MSSKRKNTPTKLAKGDGLDEVVMENGNESHNESDAESETCLTMAAANERGVEDYTDGGSPGSDPGSGSDRPQSKKQRLLQSVREDSEEEDYPFNNNINNNIMTKPSPIGLNHRKSMDNVIRRLGKNSNSAGSGDARLNDARLNDARLSNQEDLLENLKAQISSSDNMEDKEQKLAEMIAQLQSLRESIKKEKTDTKSQQQPEDHHQVT